MQPSHEDPDSRAEGLFAEFCARGEAAAPGALDALCAQHPELDAELRELARQRERLADVQLELQAGALLGTPASGAAAAPQLPGFRCTAFLGRGGMGEVWEAEDLGLRRRVAIKFLPALPDGEGRLGERFRREAEAAARLRHANVVAVLSVGVAAGRRYIVQELVAGGRSLQDALEEVRRAGEVPADWDRRVAEQFAQLADALAQAHAAGIVHRDVKPQNVLLAPDGAPKLADFGLARLEGDAALSRTGEFLGTWLYASPEQVAPDRSGVGPQSDVFSLGVALYECLTLRRPFAGDSMREIAQAIATLDPPLASDVRARVPRDLAVICAKAMEKSRSSRYASMAELRDDLRRHLASEPILARAVGPLGRARRWARRRPAAATALAALLVALPVLGGALWNTRAALAEATAARSRAVGERDVSDQVVAVLDDLFRAADPWNLGRVEPSVRDLVARGVERVRAGQPSLPEARARLLGTLGSVLSTLGDSRGAVEMLAEADALWRQMGRADEALALHMRSEFAQALLNVGRDGEARELSAALLERWRSGALEASDAYQAGVTLGSAWLAAGGLVEARAALEEALAASQAIARPQGFEGVQCRCLLAEVDWSEGLYEQGLQRLYPDADLLQPTLAAGNALAINNYNMQGILLEALGRLDEAEEVLRETHGAARDALGGAHPKALNVGLNLANVLAAQQRFQEAAEQFEELAELGRAGLGETAQETLLARNGLAICLLRLGDTDAGESILRDLLAIALREHGKGHLKTAFARLNLATACWHQGNLEEAAQLAREALAEAPEGHPTWKKARADLVLYGAGD